MTEGIDDKELRFLFALTKIDGVGVIGAMKLYSHFEKPSLVFNASPSQLAKLGLKRKSIESLLTMKFDRFDSVFDWLDEPENQVIPIYSPLYPNLLKQTATPPLFLFAIGNSERLLDPQVAVVGSRNPTPQGLINTRLFCKELVKQGLTITSGLALGIDGEAHKTAISNGGYTIAVMGTGLARVYPSSHRELAHLIANNGLLISEFFPHEGISPGCFPRRNRIIAGLTLGTLIVEAADKSGSLITAKIAMEESREVFAVPGAISNPLAQGCHSLIKQGAALVESCEDILEQLPISSHLNLRATREEKPRALDEQASILLNHIDYQTTSLDSILQRSQLPLETITNMLLLLELDGWIINVSGGYSRI